MKTRLAHARSHTSARSHASSPDHDVAPPSLSPRILRQMIDHFQHRHRKRRPVLGRLLLQGATPSEQEGKAKLPTPVSPLLFSALLALLLPIPSTTQAAGLSEPNLTLYGKVTRTSGDPMQVLHAGTLQWTVTPPAGAGAPFTLPVELERSDGGTRSYRLEIPVEKLPSGTLLSVGAIQASPAARTYQIMATFGGQSARLVRADTSAHLGTASYSEIARGKFERIDLLVGSDEPDADNDGIPDWWENLYPTVMDPANGNDALADSDGDGVPNYAEFLEGSDPSCFEWVKWLAHHQLSDAATMASDADPDNDGIANLMEYAIGSDPRTPDAHLAAQRVLTSVETINGQRCLVMTVDRPGNRHCNVDYIAETSGDIDDWGGLPGANILNIRDDRLQLKFRDIHDLAQPTTDRRFIRVRFVYKP